MLEELRYFTLPKILLGLTLTLAIILGLAVGGFQPLASILHLRTTVPYYVTLTRTVTNTTIVATTIIVNHTLTVTSQIVVTSTYTNTTTVRTVIIQPVTTTVTTTATLITPIYYTTTTTFTETITSNNLTLPPLDIYNASGILNYLVANWSLGWYAFFRSQNLTMTKFGFCISTLYILPNASLIWLGAWFTPLWYISPRMNNESFVGMLSARYGEWWIEGPFTIEYMPPGVVWPIRTVAAGDAYVVNVTNYPLPGYTVAVIGEVDGNGIILKGQQWDWDFQNLNNGTYVMAFAPGFLSYQLIPLGLCLVQVIRVNPNTPNSILLNMTYWGAQYWAWVRSIGQFGKPAPCYMPWMWTVGSALYRLNITEPIGPLWQYYCGSNGIWRNLKP